MGNASVNLKEILERWVYAAKMARDPIPGVAKVGKEFCEHYARKYTEAGGTFVDMRLGRPLLSHMWNTPDPQPTIDEPTKEVDPRTLEDDVVQEMLDRMSKPQRALMYLLLRKLGFNEQVAEQERYRYWGKR